MVILILYIIYIYRRISGAMIRISNTEEHEASGKMERAITISGQADAVNVAKTLINLRLVIALIINNILYIIFIINGNSLIFDKIE